eukprot:TRINITY_DN2289_c0_g1_i5.p1 TRINITY_DN2289_c0_g1~~TRINITY_DN2289_c0_g1_i5.p1  ORF type:complete len:218 (-),score=40.37 TRINITY_DN2289_c0_g1_i5:239-892(-)
MHVIVRVTRDRRIDADWSDEDDRKLLQILASFTHRAVDWSFVSQSLRRSQDDCCARAKILFRRQLQLLQSDGSYPPQHLRGSSPSAAALRTPSANPPIIPSDGASHYSKPRPTVVEQVTTKVSIASNINTAIKKQDIFDIAPIKGLTESLSSNILDTKAISNESRENSPRTGVITLDTSGSEFGTASDSSVTKSALEDAYLSFEQDDSVVLDLQPRS